MFITEANYTKRGQIINTLNSALWFFRKCIITLKLHPSQITNPNCLCTDSIPTLPRGPCCLLYLCTFLLCLALQPPPPFLNNFASLWQRALHCNKQMISSSNLVTLLSALEYCLDVEKLNLSAIRTVRVLRPLRAINRIPSVLMI